jgi:ketosteroid isomerase-like protein
MTEPTGEQHRRIELSRRGFDAFQRGDVEGVLAVLDPDVEVFSPPTLLNSGSFRGYEGYGKWLGAWLEAWEEFRIEVLDIETVGDRHTVIPVHQHAVGKGSGVPVEMDLAFMAELDGERFVALHLYPTSEDARAAAEQREASD